MLLKIEEGNYLNLNAVQSISLAQQSEQYIVLLTHSNGTSLLFNSSSKDKAQTYLDKFIEATKDEIIDSDGISYIADPPEVKVLSVTPMELLKEEVITITASFTKKVKNVSDLTLTVDNKATVLEELKLTEDGMSATAKYTAKTVGQCNISLKVKYGDVIKNATVEIQAQPEVTTVTANPSTIDKGANTTLTIQLDRAIKDVSEITLTVDDKLTEVTPLALTENKASAIATYRGVTGGTSNISAKTVMGEQTKTTTVTITPDPTMTVDNVPASLNVGQKQTLRISLSNATDFEIQNDNTEALTFNKQTKEVNAINSNGRPANLTFTPTRGSLKGTPIKKSINVNPTAQANEWLGDKI